MKVRAGIVLIIYGGVAISPRLPTYSCARLSEDILRAARSIGDNDVVENIHRCENAARIAENDEMT